LGLGTIQAKRAAAGAEFEWRASLDTKRNGFNVRMHASEKQLQHTDKQGYKLIKVDTKEVIASFDKEEKENSTVNTLGTLRFVGEEERFTDEFNVLALISLLSLLERGRRKSAASSSVSPMTARNWNKSTGDFFRDRCGLGGLFS
jgi:hypothetical protein